ncbi:MAG: hypothetical protein HZC41_10360 [Chloroflexi bacterium]|nr:hypothetical protein [Chloroflexota bacterium]
MKAFEIRLSYIVMKTPAPDKVSFLQIWGGGDTLPKHLRAFENPYLLALFYLARDVSKAGDWSFIYEHRNALTHRFLVLHDMNLGDQQANPDIPRAQEDTFTNQVIFATKIARAAVMYLVLFVELEEQKLAASDSGIRPTMYATPLDEGFRHRPKY